MVKIRTKWDSRRLKKYTKVHFRTSLDFLTSCFALESHSKTLKLLATWPYMSAISVPNSLMVQLTFLNWLPLQLGKVWTFGIFRRKYFCNIIKWRQLLTLLEDWKVSSCGWAKSCQLCSRSKKGFLISKIICTNRFSKNALLAIPCFSFKSKDPVLLTPKNTSMVTFRSYINVTPATISNHKMLSSMKVKVHQKMTRFLPDYFLFMKSKRPIAKNKIKTTSR